jgi:hypothetical protein
MIDPNLGGPRKLTQDEFTNDFLKPAVQYHTKNEKDAA